MKLSFGMIVLNGEPFIKYNLDNIYQHAHEILIVEGAVSKFKHASTPDGHSTDNTINIIKEYPDPDNKIKLIQYDGFWPEKDEMSNAYMERCTGDYIWQLDVDEFYKPEAIEKVRAYLSDNPETTRVEVQTVNFWHGFKSIMRGASYCFGADKFRRIFKFEPGYRFKTHRPPTIIDTDGKECCGKHVLSADELLQRLNVFMFHYSYVFEGGVQAKADYYSRMGWGGGCEDGSIWATKEWKRLSNPLRIHLVDFPPSWIEPFNGEHPMVIKQMIRDIGYTENPLIENFLNHNWNKYAKAGEYICNLCILKKQSKIHGFLAALRALSQVMIPTDSKKFYANLAIFNAATKLVRTI